MLLEHQGVRKGLFFKMLTGSISPGPQDYINILFYFIFFNKSRDFVDMRANINQTLSPDLNHDNDNKHGNNSATTAPPPAPPQLDNEDNEDNENEGRGRVEHKKGAQTTRLASFGP